MIDYETLCRQFFSPEEAEKRIEEHRQRIRENKLKLRDQLHNPRYSGVIPKPKYNEARTWVKKVAKEQLLEDMELAKKGDFMSFVPTQFYGTGLEKWMHRDRVDSFLCDMHRQGILDFHPMGGWMAARPKVKNADGKIVEVYELPVKKEDESAVI